MWHRVVDMVGALNLSIQGMPSGLDAVLEGRFKKRETMSLSEHKSGHGMITCIVHQSSVQACSCQNVFQYGIHDQ